jgi:hypothetical protein
MWRPGAGSEEFELFSTSGMARIGEHVKVATIRSNKRDDSDKGIIPPLLYTPGV